MDWNKEISKKMEIGGYVIVYFLVLGFHYWVSSGLLYQYSNQNLEWTQFQIFWFLMWSSTMIFMFIIVSVVFKKEEKLKEVNKL